MESFIEKLDPSDVVAGLAILLAAVVAWLSHRRELRLHESRLRHERVEKVRGMAAHAYGRVREYMRFLSGHGPVTVVGDALDELREGEVPSVAEVLASLERGDDPRLAGLQAALARQDERVEFMLRDLAILEAYGWSSDVRRSSASLRAAILRCNTVLKEAAREALRHAGEVAPELTEAVERDFESVRKHLNSYHDALVEEPRAGRQ